MTPLRGKQGREKHSNVSGLTFVAFCIDVVQGEDNFAPLHVMVLHAGQPVSVALWSERVSSALACANAEHQGCDLDACSALPALSTLPLILAHMAFTRPPSL